ncbi:MAG TPA: DNA cytosine methyltransferase, partial [Tepidisphaeraceae bacterium]
MSPDSDGSPTVIDLFCGAGGLSNGLEQAGFRTIAGIDFDRHAIGTYRVNHPNALALHRDIATVTSDELR